MEEKLKSTSLTIRGDSLYCPLAFHLDSYWNCAANCIHCTFRRLNHIWGTDLRPLDVEAFARKLRNGLSNPKPTTPLAFALKQKKTIRFGSKSDPFHRPERKYRVSKAVIEELIKHDWSFLIQTMFTEVLMDYFDLLKKARVVVQTVISPGAEEDWRVLERERTTPIQDRLDHLLALKRAGVKVVTNGEPFIAGYHTTNQFRDIVKRLKGLGLTNYNTYGLHANEFVYKRLWGAGIDIEKVWHYSQDSEWKKILQELIDIAKAEGVILGCPDFVNAGLYQEPTNTCCGVDVENPCTFNAITWKRRILAGEDPEMVFETSWDGVGDKALGRRVFENREPGLYSLKDAGVKTC